MTGSRRVFRAGAFHLCIGVAALVLAVGCNSAPPVAEDTRADEAAIRKTDADWVKAAATKNVDAWLAFYSDDVAVLAPNEKTAKGKQNARGAVSELLALPGLSISWEPTAVEVAKSGDIAYLYGTYQMTATGPDGKPMSDNGKMVEIWKKQADGSWKCMVDTWSSDLPAAPAPSSGK